MKKVLQIIAAALLGAGLLAGVAAADPVTCGSITNTGAGSTNTVTCVDQNNNQVTCDNNVVVDTTNNQNSQSGNASSSGNTSSGFTTSGTASANNTAIVDVGASCAPQVATTTTTTPVGGSGGATTTPTTTTPTQVSAPALPYTGSNSVQNDAVISVAALGGVAVLSRIATLAYRRFGIK